MLDDIRSMFCASSMCSSSSPYFNIVDPANTHSYLLSHSPSAHSPPFPAPSQNGRSRYVLTSPIHPSSNSPQTPQPINILNSIRSLPNHPPPHAITTLHPARHRRKVFHPRRQLHAPILPHRQLRRVAMVDLVYIPVVQDYESED